MRWSAVQLEAGRETIWLRHGIRKDGRGGWEEAALKTHQQRRIALDSETAAALLEHRERCERRAAALGTVLRPDAFVFSDAADGSTFPVPDTVSQRFERMVRRLGLRTTLHKLRHYSATELILAGVDVRTVAGRLGHAGGGTTTLKTYTAWVSEADQRAAAGWSTRLPQRQQLVQSHSWARINPQHTRSGNDHPSPRVPRKKRCPRAIYGPGSLRGGERSSGYPLTSATSSKPPQRSCAPHARTSPSGPLAPNPRPTRQKPSSSAQLLSGCVSASLSWRSKSQTCSSSTTRELRSATRLPSRETRLNVHAMQLPYAGSISTTRPSRSPRRNGSPSTGHHNSSRTSTARSPSATSRTGETEYPTNSQPPIAVRYLRQRRQTEPVAMARQRSILTVQH
ncbi:Phage integrase family protein [Pseudonocardia thermophila]|uniref:Phage integrase family protein n=2 Tax=Pseudonocardia thermophila TaxID=1848 RepID=A0A1M6S251_PSETH|nr:Phage integrase family protein [Pseudonocardia thermophila]